MNISMEPIGSVPRRPGLLDLLHRQSQGEAVGPELERAYEAALADTIARFDATGSPVLADGEQFKASFATDPLVGLTNLAPDGVVITFSDGHTRQLPRLTSGPFRYGCVCGGFVSAARRLTDKPLKQAVIAPSALSLLYPPQGVDGYPRERFLEDLIGEAERDIRSCFDAGAATVQMDLTEGRLAVKLDPGKGLLREFVRINNLLLSRFEEPLRMRIGIHTCPGGDRDATHSADVDYAELLPDLFEMRAAQFFMQLASEPNKDRVLEVVRKYRKPDQVVFVGVIDPIDPTVESPELVRDRVFKRPGTSRSIGWALPTIAASRLSATTCPPRAMSHSPRSALESRGFTSLNRCWRPRADAP